jgi:DNA polymerase (family 10)
MTNAEAAATFRLLADLLAIRGESIFKVNAYRRAAESIEALAEPLAAIHRRDELTRVPGVGKEIAQKIGDLLDTGTFPLLQQVEAVIPRGVATLLAVPSIGPKRALALYQALGISSLDALRAALAEGRLSAAGIGTREAERIQSWLSSRQTTDDRLPLGSARALGLDLIRQLRDRAPAIRQIELAGSVRRMRETIGDLDIVAAAEDPRAIVRAFLALPVVAQVERQGANRCRVVLQNGFPADLWVLPEQHWGSLLHHTTGNREHNIRLRDMSLARGASLSEYGITIGERLTPCATEGEIYAFLELPYIPPPMRENLGEIDLALRGELPAVVELGQIKGDLHLHTEWSDGTRSVRDMALAARERGYEYICVTDHSQGLAVARGLDAARLQAQRAEIEQANAELAPFRVLQGVELEVRGDGSLDLPDDVLGGLDLVVAAVHSGLRQDGERLTGRAVAALRHPLVDILAHPTGRIIGRRAGGDFDLDALYAEAARTGTVLEIDGDPARMDLRDVHARAAIAAGCMVSIDSDAHAVEGLENVFYGVGVAQRAWVSAEQVLNTLPLDALLARRKRNERAS